MTIILPGPRHCNELGRAIIKDAEGLCLDAYLCPAGVWTIGYGHTGPDVSPGQRIAEARAEELLAADLARFGAGVSRLVHVPIGANAFSALVSFAYNLGLIALEKSTLLKCLNDGRFAAAADEFLRWDKARGKRLPGLTKRRKAERTLFLTPDNWPEA